MFFTSNMLKISSQFYNMIIQSSISSASWKYYTVLNTLQWFFTFPFFNVHAVIWQVGVKVVDFLNIMWYIFDSRKTNNFRTWTKTWMLSCWPGASTRGRPWSTTPKQSLLPPSWNTWLKKRYLHGLIVCCYTEILYIGLKYVCWNFYKTFFSHFGIFLG